MYKYLTVEQRYQIDALLQQSISLTAIAQTIGVHKSTISRELKRNSLQAAHLPDKYKAQAAQLFADKRAYKPWSCKTKNPSIARRIVWLLRIGWSPQQIAAVCAQRSVPMLSTEGIYQWIYTHRFGYATDLTNYLRRRHRKRRKRPLLKQPRIIIKHKTSIHNRPQIVKQNSQVGHYEIDTAKCKNGYLLVLTERKTNYNIILPMPDKAAQTVTQTLQRIPPKLLIRSISSDNGTEFANHLNIAKQLNTTWYFADPNSPHQRGANENQIGLIRQYINRKTDLLSLSNKDFQNLQNKINHRPRKKLNFIPPIKFLNQLIVALDG